MKTDLLTNQGAVDLTKQWMEDGTVVDVGVVTYDLTDFDDTAVASGTATKSGSGVNTEYKISVPNQTELGLLTLTWTRASGAKLVDHIEVVGGQLFTEAEARNFDSATFADEDEYPDAEIAAERLRITDLLEEWTATSWIPRWRRLKLAGNNRYRLPLFLSHLSQGGSGGQGAGWDTIRIQSCTIDGEDIDVANFEPVDGFAHRTDSYWPWPSTLDPLNVTLDIVYGMPYLIDGVDRIGKLLLADRLPSSRVAAHATRFTDELGTSDFSAENMGRPTRIPEVNAWLRGHNDRARIA